MVDPSPAECLKRSNALLFRSTDADKFATLFYGVLDRETHRFACANAGHNYPLLLKPGSEPVRLDLGGLILGCLEEFSYTEGVVEFSPGDTLLIYSDGITESLDANEEEFGEERLASLLRTGGADTAERLIDRIVAAVRAHAGELSQMDDMTLLIIRRTAS